MGVTIKLDMKKETKIFEVTLCTGDCLTCNKREVKSLERTFVLTKKRVSTHYVPPDITAIKMLNEVMQTQKTLQDLSACTTEELAKLKNELITKLKLETDEQLKSKRKLLKQKAKEKQKTNL